MIGTVAMADKPRDCSMKPDGAASLCLSGNGTLDGFFSKSGKTCTLKDKKPKDVTPAQADISGTRLSTSGNLNGCVDNIRMEVGLKHERNDEINHKQQKNDVKTNAKYRLSLERKKVKSKGVDSCKSDVLQISKKNTDEAASDDVMEISYEEFLSNGKEGKEELCLHEQQVSSQQPSVPSAKDIKCETSDAEKDKGIRNDKTPVGSGDDGSDQLKQTSSKPTVELSYEEFLAEDSMTHKKVTAKTAVMDASLESETLVVDLTCGKEALSVSADRAKVESEGSGGVLGSSPSLMERLTRGMRREQRSQSSAEGSPSGCVQGENEAGENEAGENEAGENEAGEALEDITMKGDKPKGCVSITNFFGKRQPKPKSKNNKKSSFDSSVITVSVEVHPEPGPGKQRGVPQGKNPHIFDMFDKRKRRSASCDGERGEGEGESPVPSVTHKSNAVIAERDVDLSIVSVELGVGGAKEKGRKIPKGKRQQDGNKHVERKKQGPALQCKSGKLVVPGKEQCREPGVKSDTPEKDTVKGKTVVPAQEKGPSVDKQQCSEEMEAEKKKERFAVLDAIPTSGTAKKSQATLSFGSQGMKLQKAEAEGHTEVIDIQDAVGKKGKPCKGKSSSASHKRKRDTPTVDSDCENNNTEIADTRITRPHRRSKRQKGQTSSDDGEATAPTTPCKASDVYKSILLHPTRKGRKTPLKLRFLRVKEETSGDDVFVDNPKAKAKAARAKKLLEKARTLQNKKGTKTSPTSSVAGKRKKAPVSRGKEQKEVKEQPSASPGLRRSSRTSSIVAAQSISLCYEDQRQVFQKQPAGEDEGVNEKEKSLRKGSKLGRSPARTKSQPSPGTPGRKTKTKTPEKKKKAKASLAPIFAKAGKASQKVGESDDDVVVMGDSPAKVVVLTPEEQEALRIRRQFLLSGVPQELRRQAVAQQAATLSEYPPLPLVSHVQQIPVAAPPVQVESSITGPCILAAETAEGTPTITAGGITEGSSTVNVCEDGTTAAICDPRSRVSTTSDTGSRDAKTADPKPEVATTVNCEGTVKPEEARRFERTMGGGLGVCDPWNLGEAVLPALRTLPSGDLSWPKTGLGSVNCSRECLNRIKLTEPTVRRPLLPAAMLDHLLAEVSTANPRYPVRRCYKRLVARKKQADQDEGDREEPTAAEEKVLPPAENPDGPKASGGSRKRKQPEESDGQSRKRRRESGDPDVILVEGGLNSGSLRRSGRARSAAGDPDTETPPVDVLDIAASSGAPRHEAKETDDTVTRESPWTDKYAPRHSGDVLGNTGGVRKCRDWLIQWKHQTDLEIRRMRKVQLKQAKREGKTKEEIKTNLGDDLWSDDLEDFDLDSSDEEDSGAEENGLCNTMLLSGPHGVGKSALVYALAQELGYKVFEVNASGRRSGRQLLTQLQEATQSHQVCKKNLTNDGTPASLGGLPAPGNKAKGDGQQKALPSAFANLFAKKAAPKEGTSGGGEKSGQPKRTDAKATGEPAGRSAKRGRHHHQADDAVLVSPKRGVKVTAGKSGDKQSSADGEAAAKPKKGLDLSSLSLILFEEVDVVFEEDKGFWAAVETFMATTKRPIVMTTNSASILQTVKGNVEHLRLRTPATASLTSYLQLVCLAENLRTSCRDLLPLVELYGGDLRRLLLSLQLWAESGGSIRPTQQPITYRKSCLRAKQVPEQVADPESGAGNPEKDHVLKPLILNLARPDEDSGDEFQKCASSRLGPRRLLRRPIIEDDDSSRDSLGVPSPRKAPQRLPRAGSFLTLTEGEDSQSWGTVSAGGSHHEGGEGEEEEAVSVPVEAETPPVHTLAFQSLAADGCTGGRPRGLLEVLDSDRLGRQRAQGFCSSQWDINLIHANLPMLLPLPKVKATAALTRPSAAPPVQDHNRPLNRIRNFADLYDSEGSEDESTSRSKQGERPSEPAPVASASVPAAQCPDVKPTAGEKAGSALVLESLDSLSNLYDTFSYLDSCLCRPTEELPSRSRDTGSGELVSGISECPDGREAGWWGRYGWAGDMAAMVTAGRLDATQSAMATMMDRVEGMDADLQEAVGDQLTLAMEDPVERLLVHEAGPLSRSAREATRRAMDNVLSALPVQLSAQRRTLCLDYLPTVRAICCAEQLRQVTNTKRRFYHYLDNMVRQVKSSTLDSLRTSFR